MEKHQSEPDFHTTEDFWDCNCTICYIHPKFKNQCNICFTDLAEDDPPDSHIEEIVDRIEHSDQSRLMMRQFVKKLLELGFGTEEDIDGAATIDLINKYLPDLERVARIKGGST